MRGLRLVSPGTGGPQASPQSAHPDPAHRVQCEPTTWGKPWPEITRAEPPARTLWCGERRLLAQRSGVFVMFWDVAVAACHRLSL